MFWAIFSTFSSKNTHFCLSAMKILKGKRSSKRNESIGDLTSSKKNKRTYLTRSSTKNKTIPSEVISGLLFLPLFRSCFLQLSEHSHTCFFDLVTCIWNHIKMSGVSSVKKLHPICLKVSSLLLCPMVIICAIVTFLSEFLNIADYN